MWGISGRDGWGDLETFTDPVCAPATNLDRDSSLASSPGEGLERLAAFLEATREV